MTSERAIPEGAGTIVAGTLVATELISAFIDALTDLVESSTFEPDADLPERVQRVGAIESRLGELERRLETPGYRDSDEAQWDLDWLQERLQDFAPKGCWFGAHEGNDADFGFWPIDEEAGR